MFFHAKILDMDEPNTKLSEPERDDLIADFEQMGFMVFSLEGGQTRFDTLLDYTSKNLIPTYTDIDKQALEITITKRPLGSLEIF